MVNMLKRKGRMSIRLENKSRRQKYYQKLQVFCLFFLPFNWFH